MRKVKNQAITNKRKGHDLEREIVKIFKELGFAYCKTARLASKLYDNCGVDIWGIPYLVQAKKVKAAVNYVKLIKGIEDEIKKNFPPGSPEHNYPIVIFHRREKEKLIVMKEEDFLELLKIKHGIADKK